MERAAEYVTLQIENVSFAYKSSGEEHVVLENVSLTTHSSEICAIVGPSGCGKTTLIKLAISLLPFDVGSVKLFGRNAGDPSIGIPGPNVGYMPQEVALPRDLQVRDSLYFFGLLNNMSLTELRKRIPQVLEKVDLIDSSAEFIFRLSGGMKRRLSLAIAMLHFPKLLILDEPTVGSDPILRVRIWEVLKEMSQRNGTSIVITTHYYDECREADSINFMRGKTFSLQTTPDQVMRITETSNLDEAFFRLCSKDAKIITSLSMKHQDIGGQEKIDELRVFPTRFYDSPDHFMKWLKIIMVLVVRYLHSFIFDPLSVMCIVSLPTISLILAHICTSLRILDAPIGLVIENQTILHDPNTLQQLDINPKCFECLHPRHFVDFLDHKAFKVIPYENLPAALEAVERNRINGVIHIGNQFSEYYIDRVAIHWTELPEGAAKNTKITLYGDASKTYVFRALEMKLLHAYNEFWLASRINLGISNVSLFPFDYGETVIGMRKDETNPKNYHSAVGQLVSYMLTSSIGLSALSLLRELRDETMKRCVSSGIKAHHVLLAQLITNGLLFGICSILGILMTIYLLDIPFKASILISTLLIFCQNSLGILLGQLLAVSIFSEITITLLVLLISFPLSGLCGFFMTVKTQPYYAKIISNSLPFTGLTEGIRNGIVRDLSQDDHLLLEGLLITTVSFVVLTFPTLFFLRKRLL